MTATIVNKYKEPFDIYIGRGSKWGNPFVIGKHGTREQVIDKYKDWIQNQPDLLNSLEELRDKTLGCFCKPQACHGDVLIDLLNQQDKQDIIPMKQFTPMQYLAIDIANHKGLDKLPYEDRIQWVKDNLDYLETYTNEAEEPILFVKAVRALRDSQAGIPTGHTVALDSVCSGLQLMSAVMRCKDGASITGLIDPDTRTDAYTIITERMNELLKADGIADITIPRKDAKSGVMTALYGSKAVPKRVFGEELLPYFYKALNDSCGGAMKLLELLRASWDSNALVHQWVLPDGYQAYVPVMEMQEKRINITELNYYPVVNIQINKPQEHGISNIANAVHSLDSYVLRSLVRRCNYNPIEINHFMSISQQVVFLETNYELEGVQRYVDTGLADIRYITSITANNIYYYPLEMIKELREKVKFILTHKPFEVITIHDSFACHPNNCNQLRKHYNHILAELSDSIVIDDILNQLYWNIDTVEKGESISEYIRNCNYALC